MEDSDRRDPQELPEARGGSWIPLIVCVILLALSVSAIAVVRRAAEREYAAYGELCLLGATGDDWVSLLEVVTGRPPIVEIKIPGDIPAAKTFDLLPHFQSLETLSLEYDSLSESQLDAIRDLRLNSLHFSGDFPSNSDVTRLSRFRDVQFIDVPPGNLSAEAVQRLKRLLSSTEIVIRESGRTHSKSDQDP